MPVLRLFAAAREAAGLARAELDGATVGEVLGTASTLYGERFAAVLARSRVWVNGEPATDDTPVSGHDVVAVLPPVSGGAGDTAVLEREVLAPPEPPPAAEPSAPEPAFTPEPPSAEQPPFPELPSIREPGSAADPAADLPAAPDSAPPAGKAVLVSDAPAPAGADLRPTEPSGLAETPAGYPLPVAAPAPLPVPAPASPAVVAPASAPVPAPTSLPVAAPAAAPAPPPPAPVAAPPAERPVPRASPPAAVPAPAPSPIPGPPAPAAPASAPAPPRAAPVPPMAGLGGAPLPSPAALAPRDPPLVLPPPVPAPPPAPPPPRPGEIGGAAISPPPPATAAGPNAVATPEAPPVTEAEPEKVEPPPAAEGARARGWSLARFAVVYDVDRPHGRIGLAWAAVTVAAVFAGKEWLAAWLGVTAFVGASQTAAARRALEERPPPWLAALTALGPPVAAVFGGMQLVGAVLAGLALAVLVRTFAPPGSPARDLSTALLVGVATGTAAGSVVVTRELGMNPAFFLLACAAVYDVGAYLIGTGAGAAWEGPVAGMVGIVPVSILGSVLLVPPFPAGGPLLLGFLAVVLVPLGPLLATALVGDRKLDAPGLRRLDSLLLLGPMWAWAATRLIG